MRKSYGRLNMKWQERSGSSETTENKPILEPKHPPRSRVSWMTINGPRSGATAAFRDGNYLVQLDNGKSVIVHESSIRE